MANFQGHITCSALLGGAYGAAGSWYWHLDWGEVFLGAGLTTVGGMLPDLDSDSGIPVRELFGLAGIIAPILLMPRLSQQFTVEQTLVILAGVYLTVRYGVSAIFKRLTVHRGMYHSIPAMFIAGAAVFLLHQSPNLRLRYFLAVGTMLGFLSHLVLDEIFAVDLMGLTPKLNKYAGSALKFTSASWPATLMTYLLLFLLGFAAWAEVTGR